MLLKEALIGNGVNHVYSVMHLDFMGIIFYTNIGNKQAFLVRKDPFSSIGDKPNFRITVSHDGIFLGTDIGIVQLGAIEILQYCRLSVLVRDKG